MAKKSNASKLNTVPGAADRLNSHPSFVWKLIKNGDICSIRVPSSSPGAKRAGKVLVSDDEINRVLASWTVPPGDPVRPSPSISGRRDRRDDRERPDRPESPKSGSRSPRPAARRSRCAKTVAPVVNVVASEAD